MPGKSGTTALTRVVNGRSFNDTILLGQCEKKLANNSQVIIRKKQQTINYVKCLATDISATDCVTGWLDWAASNGTFVKAPGMNDWPTGPGGIPEGWTVLDAE